MIDWIDDATFELGGMRFLLGDGHQLGTMRSSGDSLVLGKDRAMVERFVAQNGDRGDLRQIVELGILQGGSVALQHVVCRPDRIVAIDIDPDPAAALEAWVSKRGLAETIRLHYGVDQADKETLSKIIEAEFGDTQLDLVVDDASHLYEPTRASFEVLFPLLREGARYVIEDWNWAHYPGDYWQVDGPFGDRPALTNLVIEILMLAGSRSDIVSEVTLLHNLAEVVRGPAPVDSGMQLSHMYRNRGLPFRPLL